MKTSRPLHENFLRLRSLLEEAVKRNLADGILFSGGLDTSILAATASRLVPLKAFTIALQGAPAPDIKYATLMANRLGLRHVIYYFGKSELYEAIHRVVELMGSFDPMEVRNSVTIYIGLKRAREEGVSKVMTGDGCDELFAGYSFLFDLDKERLDSELRKLWSVMSFSSDRLAKAFSIEAKLPYLDPDLRSFAMGLDSQCKIRDERRRRWGKWVLRKAFEGVLPNEIVWRVKTPIERGSGTCILPSLFSSEIPDVEFNERRIKYFEKDKVTIRDKEQLFYYEAFRAALGAPHPTNLKGKLCPQCGSNVAEGASYCRTCGAYPI